MIYAFTGPARKLSFRELAYIRAVIRGLENPTGLRFGGANGVDNVCAWNALKLWPDVPRVIIAPDAPWSNSIPLGTELQYAPSGGTRAIAYMNRNDMLVAPPTEALVAFPETEKYELRSGTWATIRRAKKREIEIFYHPLDRA